MVDLPAHLRAASLGENPLSRAELDRLRREAMIAKLTPLFAKRGYQSSSLGDLLAAAKVGVGIFYSLFEGKEDCFMACFESAVAAVELKIEKAVGGTADWDRATYLGLAALLDWLVVDPSAARIVLVEAQSAGPGGAAGYDAILDRVIDWVGRGRREAPAAAALPPRFEAAAVPGVAFYLQQCLLEGSLPSAEVLLAETAELILDPMVGSEQLAVLASELTASAAG